MFQSVIGFGKSVTISVIRGLSGKQLQIIIFRNYLWLQTQLQIPQMVLHGVGADLSAPKSQRFLRFAIAMPIADPRNRAISETRDSNDALRFKGAMEIASDLRFRAAISEPKILLSAGFLAIWLRQRGNR